MPFQPLDDKKRLTQKRSLEDVEDWDNLSNYFVVKRRKLRSQFEAMAGEGKTSKSTIFEGVTIYVNGWTQPNAGELKAMIYEHGGKYEYHLSSRSHVTHTIASNLPNAKILNLGQSIVCKPDWIVDSIDANEKLSVEKYLLYRTLDGQTKLEFSKQNKDKKIANSSNNSFVTDAKNIADMNGSAECKLKPSEGTEFVKEFFTHSRLHYLSIWSMELKQFMADMLKQVSPKIPKLETSASLRASNVRAVVHIDMDCFFVSVSIRDKPHLRGKPVAVTHAKKSAFFPSEEGLISMDTTPLSPSGLSSLDLISEAESGNHYHRVHESTSDIACCSYEARNFGISNGMAVGTALKKCPNLILLPYNFEEYREVSRKFYTILLQYSSVIQTVSCDEAYVEFTDYCRDFEHVSEIVCTLREEVLKQTGCTVSAGISHNMLLARISTTVAKPDGQFLLSMGQVELFLSSQNVRDLPGVGSSTATKIQDIGITTCGELSLVPIAKLQSIFGSRIGRTLHNYSHGVDDRELKIMTERKSISVDINFGIRFQEISEAEVLLGNLAEELQCRAEEAGVSGTQITLKMKIRKRNAPRETKKYLGHGLCDTVSRSMALLQATRKATECSRLAVKLLRQVGPAAEDVRGMGLQLSKLVSHNEGSNGGGGESVATEPQGQLLKFFKPAAIDQRYHMIFENCNMTCVLILIIYYSFYCFFRQLSKVDHVPLSQHHQIQYQQHQQQSRHQSDKKQLLNSSKKQRKKRTALASVATSKHSPFKQSPSKASHSPEKSPVKSLRDYFKRSSSHNNAGNFTSAFALRSSFCEARRFDDSFAVDLPPVSQLDHGVLDALPSELREKIMEGYNKQGKAVMLESPKKRRITIEGRKEELASMVMSSVDGDTGRTIPQALSVGVSENCRHPMKEREVGKEEGEVGLGHACACESEIHPMEEEEVVISDEDRFLEDWKSDIREWVSSFCEGPAYSDILAVACHFCRLVNTNLKMVEVCLKIFRRFLASRGLIMWCPCLNFLLEQIQARVKTVYGGTLKVDPLVLEMSL